MSFLQKIIDQVSMDARQKGVRCRGTGKVTIVEHSDHWIEAVVECDGTSAAATMTRRRVGPCVAASNIVIQGS